MPIPLLYIGGVVISTGARALVGRLLTAGATKAAATAISIEATGGAGGAGVVLMLQDWEAIAGLVRNFDPAEAAVLAQSVATNFFSTIEERAASWRARDFHSKVAREMDSLAMLAPPRTGPMTVAQDQRGDVAGFIPIERNGKERKLPFVGLEYERKNYLFFLSGSQNRYMAVKLLSDNNAERDRYLRQSELPEPIRALTGRMTNNLNLLWLPLR